ncbi:MAG: zinc ABC transporter substrate-binding protein [Deltaproteobacteria bacterium]|nr:zinc ABC transporter substrate-binding protein [Deltaproteobacteria bacterium]
MKRLSLRMVGAGILGVLLGLFPVEGKAAEPKLRLLATILPVYTLTLNVVGHEPGVQVELLLPPNLGCPHDYDLSPGELKRINQAGVIVTNGLGLEAFLEKALKQAGARTRVITATAGIEPLRGSGVHPEGPSEKTSKSAHRHAADPSPNGHAWVSPKQAAAMVRNIAAGLAGIDPARGERYRANGNRYARNLEGLYGEMQACVNRAPNRTVLTVHDSLDYLARDIGLQVAGTIQPLPGVEPSPREMARLVRLIREKKVTAIFSEPQYSDQVARTLAAETGIKIFSLDTAATGKPGPETYEQAMRRNLETLCRALR